MRLLLATALVLVSACTADEPGRKKCEVGTSDPDLQCVAGYFCDCKPDGCYCEKTISAQPLRQTGARGPVLREKDPNLLFLKRLGLIEPP